MFFPIFNFVFLIMLFPYAPGMTAVLFGVACCYLLHKGWEYQAEERC